MTTKTATRVRSRLIDTAEHKVSAQAHVGAANFSVDEHADMFALMLADLDSRLDAIECRTDRIAAHAV